jgi:hypothetical protein
VVEYPAILHFVLPHVGCENRYNRRHTYKDKTFDGRSDQFSHCTMSKIVYDSHVGKGDNPRENGPPVRVPERSYDYRNIEQERGDIIGTIIQAQDID